MKVVRPYARSGALILALFFLLPNLSIASPAWWPSAGISGPVADLLTQEGTAYVVAAVQGTDPGIYRSTNQGQTFTKVATFTKPFRLAQGIGVIYAATSQGLYKSSNLTTWTVVTGGLPAGKSVSYVGRPDPVGVPLYATVAAGTSRGLYRSLNSGASWTRVIANAGTQAVAQAGGCGSPSVVFAGGKLSPGGPSCTLLKSTNDGSTWSCLSFPYTVNDLKEECGGAPNDGHVHLTSGDLNTVYRSTDLGGTWVVDSTGIDDCCGSRITTYGTEVGTLFTGLYTRTYGPNGTPWSQFDTTGLTDMKINAFLEYPGPLSEWVVATPSGAFYYGEENCPPPCH